MSKTNHAAIGISNPVNGERPPITRIRLLKRVHLFAILLVIALAIGVVIVMSIRAARADALAQTAREQSTRYVIVTQPTAVSGDYSLRLPGSLQALVEAPIYARVGGYLTRWYKDIGDPVKQGELLAQIDVPEITQQLNEALALQRQTATNLKLAESTFERWEALRKRDAVSPQEFDEKRNALAVANAAAAASMATVKRLQEQVAYSRITAPFAGVITRRNIDIGNLIDAGSGTKVLFTLAKSDELRAYIYVPQNYAPQVKIGDKAEITLRELSGRKFSGTIVRTSKAIDPITRTLQVEVSLANADGMLLPGAYAEVAIRTKTGEANKAVAVPGNTLLFRPDGPRVGVVNAEGKVHLQPVKISRETGIDIELSNGLNMADRIIVNPPDGLAEGDMVTVATPTAAPTASAPSAGKPEPRKAP